MTLGRVSIRRATIADAKQMAWLHYHSHLTSFAEFASDEWLESRRIEEYESRWDRILSDPSDRDAAFAAEMGGKLVGIVNIEASGSSPDDADGSDAHLNNMHVDPEHIGDGIGKLLMSEALDFIRHQQFERVQLGVITANVRARRFYEKHGWTVAEEHPDGIEGVPIMVYELTQ